MLTLLLPACGSDGDARPGGVTPPPVAVPGPYAVKNLTTLWERQPAPDLPSQFTAVALDDRGRVLFSFLPSGAGPDVKAGIWDGSAWAVVPSPPFLLMYATSLNSQGWVGAREGFWNGSAIVSLADGSTIASTVTDLNDAGQAAGCRYSPVEPAARAMLWTGGTWRQIAQNDGVRFFGKAVTCNTQINSSGTAVVTLGQTGRADAYVWNGAGLTQIASLGGPFTAAADIDDHGNVVGSSQTADGALRAFLWDGSTMRDLGLPAGVPSTDSASGRPINGYASGANELGQVVGQYGRADGTDLKAFVWSSGTMYDLTGLIDRNDPASGSVVLRRALAINESGMILAEGAPVAGGATVAYLLTPSR